MAGKAVMVKPPSRTAPRRSWTKLIILAVVVLILVGVGVAAGPRVMDWLQPSRDDKGGGAAEAGPAAELVVDPEGRPGLRLDAAALKGLGLQTAPAREVTREQPLPAMTGTLNYDNELMYPVRSIANGRVVRIEKVFDPTQPGAKYRPLAAWDPVKENDLLAVVRSPDLADKKGAYVDALLDLYVDVERLEGLEGPYRRGAIPEGTYRDAKAKVEKDVNAAARARRTLELVPLEPKEIDDLEAEARTIRRRFKELAKDRSVRKQVHSDSEYRDRVERWARVEVRAPASGTIVEKNTNVGDITDPGKDPPPFRIANLETLSVWIHAPEEQVPVLQQLLKDKGPGEIRFELRLESDPKAGPLKGRLVRFATSVDPNQHTALLIGRVDNPGNKLLVGQLVTATIFVPADPDLVEIPMDALNEVGGQSLVFVKERHFFPGPPVYTERRVQVVNRLARVAQIQSRLHLTRSQRERARAEVRRGLRPVEPLRPGEWVVTNGVVELTDELQDKLSEAQAKEKK